MEEIEIDNISDADYQALAEFRYQIRRFLSASERLARSATTGTRQGQLLSALTGMPAHASPTIGALAKRRWLQRHSTANLADRLEQQAAVRHTRGDGERRRPFLHLTLLRKDVLRRLPATHRIELRPRGPDPVLPLMTIAGRIETLKQVEEARDEH